MTLLILAVLITALNCANSQSLDTSQDEKCLTAHNILRAYHKDTGPLTWDEDLAKASRDWALKLARSGSLRHSNTGGRYGENLYKAWGWDSSRDPNSCAKATHAWYDEEKDYDYNTGRRKGGIIGHFTQLVWKTTTKVGVGIAQKGRETVVVARYMPAGNFMGRNLQNVMSRHSGVQTPSEEDFIKQVNNGAPPKPATRGPPNPITKPPPPPVTQGPPQPRTNPPPVPGTKIARYSLAAHNILRALHRSTGALQWDETLARESQNWASELARTGSFRHSNTRGRYGENLYKSWGWRDAGDPVDGCIKAIHSWYDEEKHYDYRRGRSNGGGIVGHFTQLVWKATTKVGVGVAQKGTETVVVARYTSAGNFRGRYTENVMTRNLGARTPSVDELKAKIIEGGPLPPVTQGPPQPGTQPPPVTEPPPPSCEDRYTNCRRYRRYCKSSWRIKNGCKRTCNTC